MQPIRLGVVGPGLIWEKAHRPVLERMEEAFRITVFSGRSEHSRRVAAAEYPGAAFETDYRELVRRSDVDAVLVLTPIPLNAPVTLAALEAGKEVYLEKPMARTAEEGEAIARLARERSLRVFVLEQVAYDATYERMAEILQSGEIGDIVLYERVTHRMVDWIEHTVGGYGATKWRIQPEFPLGSLFDGGHHDIAALSMLFGAPQRVSASGLQLRPEYGKYDQVLMLFDYREPLRGIFSHSTYLGGDRNYFYVRGTEGLVAAEGGGLLVQDREGRERRVEVPPENSHERMWRAFARALREGGEPSYTLAHAHQDLRTLLAVERSIKEGRPAEV